MRCAKVSACCDHASRSSARMVHCPRPSVAQYLRSTSSHFIERLADGRRGRAVPSSVATDCHCESLQVVTLDSQLVAPRLATWPAHLHLLLLCASPQSLIPTFSAQFLAFLVDVRIHSSHSSSNPRGRPTILRSMPFCATLSDLDSSARGVQDSLHQSTHLETVESNSLRRRLIETLLFSSRRFILQNIRQPDAMRLAISRLERSSRWSIVPNSLKPSSAGTTSTEKQSSMTNCMRSWPGRLFCSLHFAGCKLKPLRRRASRSIFGILRMLVELLAINVMSSANMTCVSLSPLIDVPTFVP